MRRRDIKVGLDVSHRRPDGTVGKRLGVVNHVGNVVVSYIADDGYRGVATPAELVPTPGVDRG